MIFIIKFSIYFSISFLILSIPVGTDQKVFNYIDQLARPYTGKIFDSTKKVITENYSDVTKVSKKLFNNTAPSSDALESNLSAIKKEINDLPSEDYTQEERDAVLKILKEHN